MLNTNEARQRRGRKTRARIAKQKAIRLSVHRTNLHIYAHVISADGGTVLASASTLEAEVRKSIVNGGNAAAAAIVGKRIAEKANSAGVTSVAFDRSGNRYHGRIKALADAARENGLQF